jgi:adenine-specific DNA-methyltransferase
MPRKPRTATPTTAKIEDLRHPADVTRANIPTAETEALMTEDEAAPKPMLYPRNPDLDPQLVWRGKDELDAVPLRVPTVPIYIQEKVLPAALIRDLRRVSKGCEPQADLFGGFDRISDPEMRMEFYQHAENWSNRMILGDSLLVMNSLAEKEGLRGQVQCIYFDPPYGIRFASNWQPSTRTREVKEGRVEGVSLEPEVVAAFRDTWKDGIHSYLSYLRDRLVVARELLTESGSVFVQIGDENVHRVRALIDEVFQRHNHIATITVQKAGSGATKFLGTICDYVVWYAKDIDRAKYRPLYADRGVSDDDLGRFTGLQLPDGTRTTVSSHGSIPEEARVFAPDPLQSASMGREKGEGAASWFPIFFRGATYLPNERRRWSTNEQGMERLLAADRVLAQRTTLRFVRFLDDFRDVPLNNVWTDTAGATDREYIVQTATKVIERCILMTTDPGELVLDPTCGSGTTAFVSEHFGRRWITIDTSRVALALARSRLSAASHPSYLLRDSPEGAQKEFELSSAQPVEGVFGGDIRQGFVLGRAKKVSLGSIVHNTEIDIVHAKWQPGLDVSRRELNEAFGTGYEEWQVPRMLPVAATASARTAHEAFWHARRERQKEIDASIARHADTEYLHDRPYTKRNTVRVTGPFTVESLSPHRVLPAGEDDAALLAAIEEETGEPTPPRHKLRIPESQTDFATVVLENLRAAGVQNTRKNERLTFATLKPWPGSAIISAEGDYEENGQRKRAAIVIGPEYGTVGADLVRDAAREARDLFDTLVICGFAFDPHVGEGTMNLGRLTVLKARMNQELHAATVYKAGGGNLFVVFGEPDIALHTDPDGTYRVEIRGVDIFDPTSGEVRSSGDVKQDIACWFIDTDYDGDSFFVRHAYFLGGKDPFERLKTALRAEIDEDAWATLYRTESRPFPRPTSGRIAVKVINHHGDEAMRVFAVR